MLTSVIHYAIIFIEVKERPHRERMLYMTKEELFKKFDNVASVKASVTINCIRKAKTVREARWQAYEGEGELQGLYRGYTDVGEMFGVCDGLDEMFLSRMFSYRTMIVEELAMFITRKKRK